MTPVEEVTFKMSWGNLAAKWWGPQNVRPVLLIHGWQDSAGTFDTLAPLLPTEFSYLAIDLVGHGRSSWLPIGVPYHGFDAVYAIHELCEQQHWKKISIIGHSMGGLVAFFFSSMFPEKVDFVVSLDALKPLALEPNIKFMRIELFCREMVKENRRMREGSAPPSYTYEEICELSYEAWLGEVDRDKVSYLVARNVQKSRGDPNLYCFSRDRRVKFLHDIELSHELGLELVRRIRIPYLHFRGRRGPFTETKKKLDETIAVFKKSNPLFQVINIDGRHYFHLNTPELIADDISQFVRKYRDGCEDKPYQPQSKL